MAETVTFRYDGVVRLALRGEVDLADYDTLSAELHQLEAPHPRVLAIDLREVDYIDSTGLRWLVEANQRARLSGRRLLVILSPDASVGRLIKFCRLDDLLELTEDASAAGV